MSLSDYLPDRPEDKNKDLFNWFLIAAKFTAGVLAVYGVWKLDSMLTGMGCRYYADSSLNLSVTKSSAVLFFAGLSLPDPVKRAWESRYTDYLLDVVLIVIFGLLAFQSFQDINRLESGGCESYYRANFPNLNVSELVFYSNKSVVRQNPYSVPENRLNRFNYSSKNYFGGN